MLHQAISMYIYFLSLHPFHNMENNHVTEELSDWQQIHPPFPPISASETSVFPPVYHEDLPVSNQEDEHQRSQEPEPNSTPGSDGARRRIIPRLGAVQTGILYILRRFRNYVSCRVGFWQFAWIVSGVAAGFVVSFWRRSVVLWWQRRMQLGSSNESLMNLLREKDKKITQLLLQIAKMNEMLLARRRVPVIRVR